MKATDDRRFSLSEVYQIGQSVRSNVVDVGQPFGKMKLWYVILLGFQLKFRFFPSLSLIQVSSETNRITVSLKQSFCSSTDASFIEEYFLMEEKVITDNEFHIAEQLF